MTVRVLRLNDPVPAPRENLSPLSSDAREDLLDEIDDLENDFAGEATLANPELCLYRNRTVILLRRYLRMSLEAGRLPSLLGREFFRSHYTGYQAHTFEDVVIFVHDVEASLEELEGPDRKLIAMIVLQEHSQEEAARRLGYPRRSVGRHYAEAVDRVSKIFLRKGIMEPFGCCDSLRENSCQEGKIDELAVSDCNGSENNC